MAGSGGLKTTSVGVPTLLTWTGSAVVLDPSRESQRLRENAALGQPATVGDTPIIQPKKQGSFLGIF